jgi:glycosyltransferase involved in cell wall biosynthesis
LITVIIPIYNGVDQGLTKCLESLSSQSKKDTEVIAVDDASTDDSSKVISDFTSKINLKLLRNEENMGLAFSLNRAISNSEGEYVLIIHQDCELSGTSVLEDSELFMNQNQDVGVLVGNQIYFFSEMNIYQKFSEFRLNHLALSFEVNSFISLTENKCDLIRRNALEKIGKFDSDFRTAGEDHMFSYRALKTGVRIFKGNVLRFRDFLRGESTFYGVMRREFKYGVHVTIEIRKIRKFALGLGKNNSSFEGPKVKNRELALITAFSIMVFAIASIATRSYYVFFPTLVFFGYRGVDLYFLLKKVNLKIPDLKLSFLHSFILTILSDFVYSAGFVTGTLKMLVTSSV